MGNEDFDWLIHMPFQIVFQELHFVSTELIAPAVIEDSDVHLAHIEAVVNALPAVLFEQRFGFRRPYVVIARRQIGRNGGVR